MDETLDKSAPRAVNSRGARKGVRGQRGGSRGGGGTDFSSNAASGSGPMRRGRPTTVRANDFSPYPKDVANSPWLHDALEKKSKGDLPTKNIHKIIITNLDFGVTSTDIQELFQEFGPLKTAAVDYDESGKSLGTAHVSYDSQDAALKAVHRYNNVPLYGLSLKLEHVSILPTVPNIEKRPSSPVQDIRRGTRGRPCKTRGPGSNFGNPRGQGENKQGDNKQGDNKQGDNKQGDNKQVDNKQVDNKRGGNKRGGSKRGGRNNENKIPNKNELGPQLHLLVRRKSI